MSEAALKALKNVASEMFIQRHVEVVPDIKDLDSSNTLHALAARVNMDKDRFKNKFATFIIVDKDGLKELKEDMENVKGELMNNKKLLEQILNYTPGSDVDYMDHGQVSTFLGEYLLVTFTIDQGTVKYKMKKGKETEGDMYCTPEGAKVEKNVVPICFGNKLDDKGKKTDDIHIVHYGAINDASGKSVHIGGMKSMTKEHDEIYEIIAEMKTEIRKIASMLKHYAPHAPLAYSQPRYSYGNERKAGKRRPKNRDEKSVMWV